MYTILLNFVAPGVYAYVGHFPTNSRIKMPNFVATDVFIRTFLKNPILKTFVRSNPEPKSELTVLYTSECNWLFEQCLLHHLAIRGCTTADLNSSNGHLFLDHSAFHPGTLTGDQGQEQR